MTNTFDDENGTFYILINDEGQYCLLPTFVDVPAGWNSIYEPASRQSYLDNINLAAIGTKESRPIQY